MQKGSFAIRISEELRAKIRKLADIELRSMSRMAEILLEEAVARREAHDDSK